MLEAYADFVEDREYGDEYLSSAKAAIERTARFLFERLVADGRKGACVDASCVLSRFLERQGVWNYVVKGALTIVFPPGANLKPRHFCPIMATGNPAVAGHAWVCAPPFRVVDLTVALQPYEHGEEHYLGDMLLEEAGVPVSVTAADLFDPNPAYHLRYGRPFPSLDDAKRECPALFKRIDRYGALEVTRGQTCLRYFATAISASDTPLETARNLQLSGKWPIDLWQDFESSNAR